MDDNQAEKQILLGFLIPDKDAASMRALLAQIRKTPHQKGLSQQAANMVARLLDLGINAFYYDVMSKITIHPSAQKSADTGIHTVNKGAKLVIKKMVNSLEPEELPIFADCIDALMVCKQHDQWHLAFPLSAELAKDLDESMKRIHSDANTAAYNQFIVQTLCKISDQAIIHFYNKPTQRFEIRPFVKKSADLGIRTVNRGLHFVVKQLLKKTRQKELIKFTELLENQLVHT